MTLDSDIWDAYLYHRCPKAVAALYNVNPDYVEGIAESRKPNAKKEAAVEAWRRGDKTSHILVSHVPEPIKYEHHKGLCYKDYAVVNLALLSNTYSEIMAGVSRIEGRKVRLPRVTYLLNRVRVMLGLQTYTTRKVTPKSKVGIPNRLRYLNDPEEPEQVTKTDVILFDKLVNGHEFYHISDQLKLPVETLVTRWKWFEEVMNSMLKELPRCRAK